MPLAAFLPAIIGAGGAIGSSLINKSSSKASSKTPLLPAGLDQNALLSSINTQKGLASTFQTQGNDLLGKGQGVLSQPLSWLQAVASGDRTKIMEAMAPGIAAINAQFGAPLKEAGISGRGSSLAPDLEASKQSAISNQIFQAQPVAEDKLTSIAQNLMSLGTQQETVGAGVAGDVSKELLDYNSIIRGLRAQASSQNAAQYGQLGGQLGGLISQILLKQPGSGTPATALPGPSNPANVGGGPVDVPQPNLLNSLLNYDSPIPKFNSSWLTGGGDNG